MSEQNFAVGTVEGTGSAINISIGFNPQYVKCINIDDAGTLFPIMEWITGMAAASGILSLKVIDSGSTGLASSAYVTAGGITMYAGSESSKLAKGFTIGTDANLNADGETILWIAMRS